MCGLARAYWHHNAGLVPQTRGSPKQVRLIVLNGPPGIGKTIPDFRCQEPDSRCNLRGFFAHQYCAL